MASYSSSSSASPALRLKGEPNAGLGARGGGDTVRVFVDVLEPELEFPLAVTIRPLCRRDMRLLLCFSNDSSKSTWIVATIGAGRIGRGGGDDGGPSMWECDESDDDDADDVERGFLRRVTGVG